MLQALFQLFSEKTFLWTERKYSFVCGKIFLFTSKSYFEEKIRKIDFLRFSHANARSGFSHLETNPKITTSKMANHPQKMGGLGG